MERPNENEYAPFYAGYVALVAEDDIVTVLEEQRPEIFQLAAAVAPERETYRYADGKWSIRELFGHLTDAERLFGYRAFCISRGDQTSLPGWDENEYMATATFDRRPLFQITREFSMLRNGNLAFLRTLDDEAWRRMGTANGNPVSVRANAYIMAGHLRHHLNVLGERYGITTDSVR